MNITFLQLTSFRNYETLEMYPSEGLNILVGKNAQGKSGILESIYLLATSKSHRTSKDLDIIKIGDNFARVFAKTNRDIRNDTSLEIILSRSEKKSIKINSVKHLKIGDLLGNLNAVIFSSTDIDMVKGEPAKRRRFLNLEISQISPQYIYSLGRYKRVLEQRNNLLKDIKYSRASISDLHIWNEQLASYGANIIIKRFEYMKFLSDSADKLYSFLTRENEKLEISYKPNPPISEDCSEEEIKEIFLSSLLQKQEIDLQRGTTHAGPHRDDISLKINGLSVKDFASQGQQRSAAIAIKLAEIDLVYEKTKEYPIVLLDDIMGELDETRRSQIFGLTCGKCQTFITTTHLSDLGNYCEDDENTKIFNISEGKIIL